VDRIVPGKLSGERQQELEQVLGYEDRLLIMAEPYALWAIESADSRVQKLFSFHSRFPGLVLAPDISKFRELKLRLLNGSHTGCCGLAVLAGFATVREAMESSDFSGFISGLMYDEIVPAITGDDLSSAEARDFATGVLDRFRNPYMEHAWLAISLQYSSKFRMRLVPVLQRYHERFGRVPFRIALGLAAQFLFLRVAPGEGGQYYGQAAGKQYLVQDEQAPYFAEEWREPEGLVDRVLSNASLWGVDLGRLPGLSKEVNTQLQYLLREGAGNALKGKEAISNPL
jgi:tagaturonate reductase